MSFRDKQNPNSGTNEFDLAKEAFRLLTAKMADYERLAEIQQQVADKIYDVLRSIQAVQPQMAELKQSQAQLERQMDRIRTQQAEIILEAKLIHRDLDVLLDLFGDVATYAKDDSPPLKTKRVVYGDAG